MTDLTLHGRNAIGQVQGGQAHQASVHGEDCRTAARDYCEQRAAGGSVTQVGGDVHVETVQLTLVLPADAVAAIEALLRLGLAATGGTLKPSRGTRRK